MRTTINVLSEFIAILQKRSPGIKFTPVEHFYRTGGSRVEFAVEGSISAVDHCLFCEEKRNFLKQYNNIWIAISEFDIRTGFRVNVL